MKAMLLDRPGAPLRLANVQKPVPKRSEVLLEVRACAVCRTDLHVVDGELPDAVLPIIPGHEIVGTVVESASRAEHFKPGMRLGVPWLGWTCGNCEFCRSGAENLCTSAKFTGYTLNGGYAEYTAADARYCFPLPDSYDDVHAAPLLCAGLIGYRSYCIATEHPVGGEAARLGLYGFGAAAHLITQIAIADGRTVFAFTREGDSIAQNHARSLGAAWAGGSDEAPPEPLDASIIFAPIGSLIPAALRVTRPGGVVVSAGIHMSDIPAFPYELLWRERSVRSVANLTRADGADFLAAAGRVPLRVDAKAYPLEAANEALNDLREGRVQGAAVLVPSL